MKLDAISKLSNVTPMFKVNKVATQPSKQNNENSEIKPGFAIGCDGDIHPESRTAVKGQKLYLLA